MIRGAGLVVWHCVISRMDDCLELTNHGDSKKLVYLFFPLHLHPYCFFGLFFGLGQAQCVWLSFLSLGVVGVLVSFSPDFDALSEQFPVARCRFVPHIPTRRACVSACIDWLVGRMESYWGFLWKFTNSCLSSPHYAFMNTCRYCDRNTAVRLWGGVGAGTGSGAGRHPSGK